ncbi:MAG: hypothetical protein FWF92_06705 [Oscillospiraceae bacterium]|nr:hypothetical protein [Oscillospiraceae bacterium]
MKFRIKTLFKFVALILCIAMILPVIIACGDKAEEADKNTEAANNAAGDGDNNAATPEPTPAPAPEPTPEPETEPPTEPIDPNLPYYEYLDEEFARFGFTGGDRIMGDTEEEVNTSAFHAKDCSRTALDISGDGVPFEYAYRYEITSLPNPEDEFWQKACEANFRADKTLAESDIIAGCVYVRDGGGENPAQFYFAIKTPTNDWGSEGDMNIALMELESGGGWQKVYFYGESSCDEDPASTALFELFLGYEPHSIDIGGIYMMRYPSTGENMKATMKLDKAN